ncbi:MAG TPA: AAA family ATPase [Bacillus bacterium]|nr:AAA family ATPase [Bacillus sp. (in: firmicutes)]
MRFNYLNLRAFGHFTDYEITFDQSKKFHLIYGLNEAGKSTALRSINHFLYGFPQQTADSFLHSNQKLRIEGELQNKKGETLQFTRRKGKKNTVINANGEALNEGVVANFLNGLSLQHFSNMFALNHVSLREGGASLLQSGGNVGESLFSAASGISMLRKVFEELEKKLGDLYKKRGSTPELNKLLKEEKELKKEISDCQLKVQAWKELERKYSEGKSKIETLINEIISLRSEREKLQRIKLTLPKIAKLKELANRLAELGEVPALPDNIVELRKETVQKLESLKKQKQSAEEDYQLFEKERNEIKIQEGLLEQSALIDILYREVQSYQNNLKLVPQLEGERKLLLERVKGLMKEFDPVHATVEQIDKYRLPVVKKERIRELCKQRPLLDQAIEQNEKERQTTEDELKVKRGELNTIPVPPNIEELEAVIDSVKRLGEIEELFKTHITAMSQKEKVMKEAVKELPLWNRTYEELIHLPVPILTETIKKFEREHFEIVKNLEKTIEQINSQIEAIESIEEQIRTLEALSEIPSEETLLKIRTHRNQGWQFIRIKLQEGQLDAQQYGEFTNGEKLENVYENLVHHADELADKMRSEAEKVGAKKKHVDDIKSCQKKIVELENKKSELTQKLAQWENAWAELWKPTTIAPLSPEEMREWLVKYEQIKAMYSDFERSQITAHELEMKITEHKEMLRLALSPFIEVSEHTSLVQILKTAEKEQKKMNDDVQKRTRLEDSISGINHRINHIALKNKDIYQKSEKWYEDWAEAISGTNLTESTSVDSAEKIIRLYEDCAEAYDELTEIEKKHESMLEQLSHYEQRVGQLLRAVALDFGDQAIDIVVTQLNANLQQAKQDEVKIIDLNKQLKKIDLIIKEAVREIETAESVLENLMNKAQVSTISELEKVEITFLQKKEYEEKRRTIEEELLDIGGGLSLQQLIEEANQFQYDCIDIELEELNRKLVEIEPVRSELEQAHGVVKKEFEEKIDGNNTAAVLAEQKKESVLAKLANSTEQYIQVKLASILLQKGIEHYRKQNQDPILKRAGELFARLTLQSFSELVVDYDEKDQPILMGVRPNGDKVAIEGMSDGTTDQLYLSLRIASIEKYGEEQEPIPFIVDDILVHFDDVRSEETLKILLELSQQTQIIFFTHHSRLVEIMKELTSESNYQLTELTSKDIVIA